MKILGELIFSDNNEQMELSTPAVTTAKRTSLDDEQG